jgi:transcriptional regulator with XRE-family HTH domain
MSELSDTLALRIKNELFRRQISQKDFAERVGMSEKHVSSVLSGKVTAQVNTYQSWAGVLGMSWDVDLRQVRKTCSQHTWKVVVHLDGCHTFESHYVCTECGATRLTWSERKMGGKKSEPYASVWALPDCKRCQELLAGRKRKKRVDRIVEPKVEAA